MLEKQKKQKKKKKEVADNLNQTITQEEHWN